MVVRTSVVVRSAGMAQRRDLAATVRGGGGGRLRDGRARGGLGGGGAIADIGVGAFDGGRSGLGGRTVGLGRELKVILLDVGDTGSGECACQKETRSGR